MSLSIYRVNDTYVVTLGGVFDVVVVSESRGEFQNLSILRSNILIDLGEVYFIDSSGIGELIFLYKRLAAYSRTLALVNVKDQPAEIIKMLNVDQTIKCYKSIKAYEAAEMSPNCQCSHQ